MIAYLEQEHEDSMIKHSVIVNGINDNKTKIYCIDPFYEESITRNVGAFLEDWERMYRYVVHLSVEEDETLDAYVEEEKAQ